MKTFATIQIQYLLHFNFNNESNEIEVFSPYQNGNYTLRFDVFKIHVRTNLIRNIPSTFELVPRLFYELFLVLPSKRLHVVTKYSLLI